MIQQNKLIGEGQMLATIIPIGLSKNFKLSVREDAKLVLKTMDQKVWKKFRKLHARAKKFGSVNALANMLNLNIRFSSARQIRCYGAKTIGNYIFLVSFDLIRLTIHAVIDILRLKRSIKKDPCLVLRETAEIGDGYVCVDMHVIPQGLHKFDETFCGVALSWHGRFRSHFVPRLQLAHAYQSQQNHHEFELRETNLEDVRH